MGLHSCAAGLVDDNRFPGLIHIVVQPKVSCHPMDEHPLIGWHLRELFIMVTGKEHKKQCNQHLCFWPVGHSVGTHTKPFFFHPNHEAYFVSGITSCPHFQTIFHLLWIYRLSHTKYLCFTVAHFSQQRELNVCWKVFYFSPWYLINRARLRTNHMT